MLNSYEGIVLKSIDYGESDKILHILTKECGKLTCIAKGVRRSKKRDVNVDLFSHSFFQMYKGRGFYQVNQSERIDSNFGIREDIEKLSYASFVLEIVDLGLPEEEENERVFELLSKTLKVISEGDIDMRKLLVSFELKFVSFLGYKPELKRCINCGNTELKGANYISYSQGGVLCNGCKGIDKYSNYLDESMHKLIYSLLYSKFEDLKNIESSDCEIRKAQDLVFGYLKQHIDRYNFKSIELLKTLNLI
jgi:DNA repair protein RecO (recombination protein O)